MTAYVGAVFVLFIKLVIVVATQGVTRMRTRTFAYPEDAAHWSGEAVERESDLVVRAQRVLRNDGESQPFFLVFGGLYLVLGATPWAAWIYFPAYALARVAHTWFFLRPRQPHRNRAFAVGLIVTAALALHCAVSALRPLFA